VTGALPPLSGPVRRRRCGGRQHHASAVFRRFNDKVLSVRFESSRERYRSHRNRGPEVLKYVDKPRPSSRRGEVLNKAEAIGVNFVDTCFRSGLYPRELPCCHMAIQLNHRAAVHVCHRLTVEPGSDPAAIWPAGAAGYFASEGDSTPLHPSLELAAVGCGGYSVEAVGDPGHASLTVDIGL